MDAKSHRTIAQLTQGKKFSQVMLCKQWGKMKYPTILETFRRNPNGLICMLADMSLTHTIVSISPDSESVYGEPTMYITIGRSDDHQTNITGELIDEILEVLEV